MSLLTAAQAGPLDETGRAGIDLLRAQIAYNSSHGNEACPLLLAAARRFEPLDRSSPGRPTWTRCRPRCSRGAWPPAGLRRCDRWRRPRERRPGRRSPGKADLLLEGMAVLYTDGYAASAPLLHRAVQAFGSEDLTLDEAFRGAWVAAVVAVDLWDDVHWDVLSQRHLDAVRAGGSAQPAAARARQPRHLRYYSGDLAAADVPGRGEPVGRGGDGRGEHA